MLGDGDGRFLAALLAQNPKLSADAVDTSGAMLALLRERCRQVAPDADSRVTVHQTDALSYVAASPRGEYDLVVTHFFLDCLTQLEVDALAAKLAMELTPGGCWLVSDFRIPEGPMRIPAKALVSLLYLAFRILTGMRTNRLPDHTAALIRAGFIRIDHRNSLFGILITELWRTGGDTCPSTSSGSE